MNTLVLISGPPGVGKSSLAKLICQYKKYLHIDKDDIDEPFSPNDRGSHYTQEIEPKSLQVMFNIVSKNLEHNSIILDAPWTHIILDNPHLRKKIKDLSLKARLLVIELFLSEDLLKKRIEQRKLLRDQEKLTSQGWIDFLERDKVQSKIPLDHVLLDAKGTVSELFEQIKVKL